jgi:hypothetical protein
LYNDVEISKGELRHALSATLSVILLIAVIGELLRGLIPLPIRRGSMALPCFLSVSAPG